MTHEQFLKAVKNIDPDFTKGMKEFEKHAKDCMNMIFPKGLYIKNNDPTLILAEK